MRKSLLGILMVLALGSGVALAQTTDDATATVYIDVTPNVGVSFVSGADMGTIGAIGKFSRPLIFQVDANKQEVDLSVGVTKLYKDGLPAVTAFKPIEIFKADGVAVVPAGANRLPTGVNDPLAYVGTAETDQGGGFLGYRTSPGTWGSALAVFSKAVTVTPTWELIQETVIGHYIGKVTLYAVVN
jgi:hypothetical protein